MATLPRLVAAFEDDKAPTGKTPAQLADVIYAGDGVRLTPVPNAPWHFEVASLGDAARLAFQSRVLSGARFTLDLVNGTPVAALVELRVNAKPDGAFVPSAADRASIIQKAALDFGVCLGETAASDATVFACSDLAEVRFLCGKCIGVVGQELRFVLHLGSAAPTVVADEPDATPTSPTSLKKQRSNKPKEQHTDESKLDEAKDSLPSTRTPAVNNDGTDVDSTRD